MNRLVATMVVSTLLLSGCWSKREINNLAIVFMIGVDITESGETELWLSLMDPQQGTPGSSGSAARVVQGHGETIGAAIERIQALMPHRIYWGHSEVLIVGEGLAREGISPVLDHFARQRDLRLSSYVLVARENLSQIFHTSLVGEPQPAKGLVDMLRTDKFARARVYEVVDGIGRRGQDPILGTLELATAIDGTTTSGTTALRLAGTGLLKHDKLVGTLDEQMSRGLRWVREPTRGLTLPVRSIEDDIRLTIVRIRTGVSKRAFYQDGRLKIAVTVDAQGELGLVTSRTNVADPAVLKQVEKMAAHQIKAEIMETVSRLQELNADAVGFGQVIHRQMPAVWRKISGTWREHGFQELEVIPNVSVRIENSGVSRSPVGAPANVSE